MYGLRNSSQITVVLFTEASCCVDTLEPDLRIIHAEHSILYLIMSKFYLTFIASVVVLSIYVRPRSLTSYRL
jgi:hypothetical protein